MFLGVRFLLWGVYTVGAGGGVAEVLSGDRVVVDRWSYGFRSALFTDSVCRYRASSPMVGDWAMFNSPTVERGARPDTSALCVGRVMALPGDTVWMGYNGAVSASRSYKHGCLWPVMVPAKGSMIRVYPWSALIYARIIQTHEQHQACVVDTALFVDDRKTDMYRFARDYYWVESGTPSNFYDSRTFGPVPSDFFVGRISMVLYSFDPDRPMWEGWRGDRVCRRVE